jgi:hypothetical protein
MHELRSIGRTRQMALVAGLAMAAFAVFLAGGLFSTSVTIQTGSISSDPSGPVGCYTSGTSGDLVTDAVSGVAIIEKGGRRVAVTWPPGWTGRTSGSEVEILDSRGGVHMRTGTHVYLMGGYWYVNGSFLTCGGRTGF